MWIIEKEIKKGDYLYAKVSGHPKATKYGYVLYHRIVMENYLGRLLLDTEVVHHINHNKFDNKIENLQVLSAYDHAKLHSADKSNTVVYLTVCCAHCGKAFLMAERDVNYKTKHNKNILCSRRCNILYTRSNGKFLGSPKDTNHGINLYRYGCRCDVCKEANRLKGIKDREKKRKNKEARENG